LSKPDKVLFGSGYHYITGIVVVGAGLLASLFIGFNVESLLLVIFSGLSATAFVYLAIVRQLNRLVKLIRSGERKPAAELEGQFHELYGFYRNLSLQVEQERNYYEKLYRDYSELLNTLNISVVSLDGNENIDLANEAFVKSFSYGTQNMRYLRLDHFIRRTGLLFPLQEGQYDVYSKKLGRRYLVTVTKKKRSGFLVTLDDKTSQWKTKQLLEKTRRYAVDAQTVADLAHGLKQPLANMRLALDLYIRSRKDSYLQTLSNELSGFQVKVGGILQIFRYGEEFERLDLSESVKKVLSFMEPILAARSISLDTISLDDGKVLVQKGRLENVVKNLLMNALEASEDGGAIALKVRRSSEYLTLIVSDRGKGIDESIQAEVFKPFYTTKPEGSGLGLYLVKNFCDENDVRLKMKSVPVKGTVFVLTFRRNDDESQDSSGR
jgi:signal transduction histidine kinase